MSIKPITQNPDRYTTDGKNWKISASTNIKPIYLPIGIPLSNLRPVIKGNGIIVKVGENYLCSLQTLNDIKDSKNPHYDIIENGKLKVKDKEVIIGKTIKIIELDVTKLQSLGDSRDFMNRQSGVINVEYTNEGITLIDGIPKKLIDQINYTLDKESIRPSDKFEVVDYFKMVDKKVNPHYTFVPIRVETDQEKTIFDPRKLQTFLIELSEQLKLLRRDFNILQKTFFEGNIPTPNIYGIIQEDILAQTDTDDLDSRHSNRIVDNSTIITVEPTPVSTTKEEIEKLKQEIETGASSQPITTPPVIKLYRMKRIGRRNNGMAVINTPDITSFSKSGELLRPKSIRTIREGSNFSGYLFKKEFNGKYNLWALQTDPNVPPKEWAYQGPGDNVEPLD